MNQVEIVCIIVASVGAVFGVCGFVFPLLSKKGVNTEQILSKVDSGLEIAGKAVDTIKSIAPGIPYISTADTIIKCADVGAKKAEQLYNANKISADARKTEAVKLTKDLLTAAKVEITPEIDTIIDGCVEAAVFALPQTHTEENDKRYADLAAQDNVTKALKSAADAVQAAQEAISGTDDKVTAETGKATQATAQA